MFSVNKSKSASLSSGEPQFKVPPHMQLSPPREFVPEDTTAYLSWASESNRTVEWNIARSKLITNDLMAADGSELKATDSNGLKYSFMVLDQKIIAFSKQPCGVGSNGDVFLGEDEEKHRYAIKKCRYRESMNEARIAHDLGVAGMSVEKENPRDGSIIQYIPFDYLGISLHRYLIKNRLTSDQRYQLAIDTVLIFDELHSGAHSKTGQGYIHWDIHSRNILIDDLNQPHLIDFGLSIAIGAAVEGSEPISWCDVVLRDLPDIRRIVSGIMYGDLLEPPEGQPLPHLLRMSDSALSMAKVLTEQRWGLSRGETLLHLGTRDSIRTLNTLYSNNIPLLGRYFESEVMPVIQHLQDSGIKITPSHLTPEGLRQVHALQSIGHAHAGLTMRAMPDVIRLDELFLHEPPNLPAGVDFSQTKFTSDESWLLKGITSVWSNCMQDLRSMQPSEDEMRQPKRTVAKRDDSQALQFAPELSRLREQSRMDFGLMSGFESAPKMDLRSTTRNGHDSYSSICSNLPPVDAGRPSMGALKMLSQQSRAVDTFRGAKIEAPVSSARLFAPPKPEINALNDFGFSQQKSFNLSSQNSRAADVFSHYKIGR